MTPNASAELFNVVQRGDLVELLVQHGADIDALFD